MHYGTLRFKCNRRSCKFFRIGFSSRVQRDNHVNHHERRFKCSQPNCDFLTFGFISQIQLDHHLKICHPKNEYMKRPESNTMNLSHLDTYTTNTVLLDAVKIGHATYLETLLEAAHPHIQKYPHTIEELLCTALQGTSIETVKILLAAADKDILFNVLTEAENSTLKGDPFYWAAKGNSLEMAEFLISKGVRPGNGNLVRLALSAACENSHLEMVQLLLQYNPNWDTTDALQRLITKGHSSLAGLDIAQLLVDRGADLGEIYLSVDSVDLATFLLGKGFDVNKIRDNTTTLYRAVKEGNRKGIEFAKSLLENGADPTIKCRNRLPGDLAWASKCPKILGVTWDELVASTWGSRHSEPTGDSVSEIQRAHNPSTPTPATPKAPDPLFKTP